MDGHILGRWNFTKSKVYSLWNYDTKNHTENFCDTEKSRKPHWKNIYKGSHSDNPGLSH